MKRSIQRLCVAAAMLVGLSVAGAARATLIFVPNGAFASPAEADNAFSDTVLNPSGAVPNWTFDQSDNGSNAAGVWDPVNINYSGSTGDNVALPGAGGVGQTSYIYLQQFDDLNPLPLGGRLTSEVITNVASNFTYTLTVAVGNANMIDDGSNTNTFVPVEPGDVTLRILAGGDVVADTFIPAGTLANNTFTNFVTTYTTSVNDARAGLPLTIELVHSYSGVGFREADFANVRLDAQFIPEPNLTAFGMLGIATVFIGCRRAARQTCD